MVTQVVKRDGTKEPFDAEKIKRAISLAAVQAGIIEERKNQVIEQVMAAVIQMVGAQEEVVGAEIREKVLSELDKVEPTVSKAWREYDQQNKAA